MTSVKMLCWIINVWDIRLLFYQKINYYIPLCIIVLNCTIPYTPLYYNAFPNTDKATIFKMSFSSMYYFFVECILCLFSNSKLQWWIGRNSCMLEKSWKVIILLEITQRKSTFLAFLAQNHLKTSVLLL